MLTGGRLFKFPQMDFEMAIWEMTSLLIAPKKVFKSMYYHVCILILSLGVYRSLTSVQKRTQETLLVLLMNMHADQT